MKLSAVVSILLFSVASPFVQGACNFCTAGFDDPDAMLPGMMTDDMNFDMTEPQSCADIQAAAALAGADECEMYSAMEAFCCRSTTDQYLCDFCEFEIETEDSFVCSFMMLGGFTARNETACALIKVFEPLCCPSKADYKLPPVTEGETCYICGNEGVKMTTPDAKPLLFQESDNPADRMTCAQSQDALNEQRKTSGQTCSDTVSSLYIMFSPSICGCEGFSPPSACSVCAGGTVNRDAKTPDGMMTCGEAYDMLQHFTPGGCKILDLAEGLNRTAIDKTCCTYNANSSSGQAHGISFLGLVIAGLLAIIAA